MTLLKVWKQAGLLEADLHAIFGWDVYGPERDVRTGPWLRRRVEALVFHETSMVLRKLRCDVELARSERQAAEKKSA